MKLPIKVSSREEGRNTNFVFLPSTKGLSSDKTVSYTHGHFNTSLPSAPVRALAVLAGPIPPELTADT